MFCFCGLIFVGDVHSHHVHHIMTFFTFLLFFHWLINTQCLLVHFSHCDYVPFFINTSQTWSAGLLYIQAEKHVHNFFSQAFLPPLKPSQKTSAHLHSCWWNLWTVCMKWGLLFTSFFSFLSDTECESLSPSCTVSICSPVTSLTFAFICLFLSLCLQCVHLAARSSWSRGWGRTGSSSFCWGWSWLWSAGSWTTPSPSAKKVGKRQRARKRGRKELERAECQWISHSQRQN